VDGKKIVAIDSTTIALFKDILKAAGRRPVSGKIKGGIKVHTELVLDERVPQLIWYSAGASNDVTFVQKREFKKENIYVFDRGYIDYEFYESLNQQDVSFVTRLKDNASYESIQEYDIQEDAPDALLKDERIELPIRKNGHIVRTVTLRRIAWWDESSKRHFIFLSNMFDVQAETIAGIYRQRWQVELLFKQLKQNFPLKYFLGDNENAITIQIWCTLIANLLMTVIQKQLKRSTAFSFIASFIRVNLINYIHLIRFLNNPEKDWSNEIKPDMQQSLFSP
jgi:transposase